MINSSSLIKMCKCQEKVKHISYKITKKLLRSHESGELGHSHQSDESFNFLILSFFDMPMVDD